MRDAKRDWFIHVDRARPVLTRFMLTVFPIDSVDSILLHSLMMSKSCHGSSFWLTDSLATASGYMRGASRLVAFAVLKPKGYESSTHIVTDPR